MHNIADSKHSKALDDRIDEFGELIREHYNITELGDPSFSTDVGSSFPLSHGFC